MKGKLPASLESVAATQKSWRGFGSNEEPKEKRRPKVTIIIVRTQKAIEKFFLLIF